MPDALWEFWIDAGGTFTDCIARAPSGALHTFKILSTGVFTGVAGPASSPACVVDPARREAPRGFFEGWRLRILPAGSDASRADADYGAALVARFDATRGGFTLQSLLPFSPAAGSRYVLSSDFDAPIVGIRWLLGLRPDEPIGSVRVRLGTTRGTNALLERQGARVALVTTAGLGDVLRIGYQARPRLFDLHIRKPDPLFEESLEIAERVAADGSILEPLDRVAAAALLTAARRRGIDALAICLLNSYRNPMHEQALAQLGRAVGFQHISVSSQLAPVQGLVARGETTVVDAYLTPVLRAYIARLRGALPVATLHLMTSSGALVDAGSFVARDSVLSGPAAGVVGLAQVARAAGVQRVIGFDMGGTSTDVSRYDGEFERRGEMLVEDRATGGHVRIVGDMLAIETVAAGGGSVCDFDGIKPIVGPRSAGADPGPACYGRGGPLCLTDVNIFLGRIPARFFPFPLDLQAVRRRLRELRRRITIATGRRYRPRELAEGLIRIANTHMADAIRRISTQRGYDPREYALVGFGGAGGQHVCGLARELGVRTVVLHPLAGLLSALGMGVAPISRLATRSLGAPLSVIGTPELDRTFDEMAAELARAVRADAGPEAALAQPRCTLDLRYAGQSATIPVSRPDNREWRTAFEALHQRWYGFTFGGREIEVVAARCEVATQPDANPPATPTKSPVVFGATPSPIAVHAALFDGRVHRTPVFDRATLPRAATLQGPAIVVESSSTIVVEPGWTATLADNDDVILRDAMPVGGDSKRDRRCVAPISPDPVTLELFNRRFAAIAEQMGETLRRTALSANVRERLDFSCAVYDRAGELVANAPHIPVHLGAMGECIRCIVLEDALKLLPGDVIVTNDPYRGGSHLPDVTVITPVFDAAGRRIDFYVASRAHHAEIGGIAPGSMPPESRRLAEEGVLIPTLHLVTGSANPAAPPTSGEAELRSVLTEAPYPSRAVDDNLADARAQAAANACGVRLLTQLVGQHGVDLVRVYMRYIREAAAAKTRAALRRLGDGEHRFVDYLDDGTPIAAAITIRDGSVTIDFSGSGTVHPGNLNATPAIVRSAVMYCIRCLIADDIPLNAGVLAPVTIILPTGVLNPPAHADPRRSPAVAGGNVETSQRIVDAIFGALGLVAAGQGTMNNLSFGDATFGYYETIAGGSGAGPDFDGADAVHTHMTNTRLTDPEVLEARFPVRLRRFAIRADSGGLGFRNGGHGLIRALEFLRPLRVSLLTERRTLRPYGVCGGAPGASGRNTLIRRDGSREGLMGRAIVQVAQGDIVVVETPGGGGFGRPG